MTKTNPAAELARDLRDLPHGFTTILRARAARYAAAHPDEVDTSLHNWATTVAGDPAWELETVAQLTEGYREPLLRLLDRARDANPDNVTDEEWNRAVTATTVADWWALRDIVLAVAARLKAEE